MGTEIKKSESGVQGGTCQEADGLVIGPESISLLTGDQSDLLPRHIYI